MPPSVPHAVRRRCALGAHCGGPRSTARCGVSFARAANALFYQFGADSEALSVLSIATRLVVGVLSSLIVFVPTTIISFIFRRVKHRDFLGLTFDELTNDDLSTMKIDVCHRGGGWEGARRRGMRTGVRPRARLRPS